MSRQRHAVAPSETKDKGGIGAAGRRMFHIGMAAFIRVGELEGKGKK